MLLKKFSFLICASLLPSMTFAQEETNSTIDAFLQCDNQFFHQLQAHHSLFNQYADLVTTDDIAYFPVEDVENNDKNTVMFKMPIHYHGLTISGYQNIYIETPLLGQYYYWGLIMDNSVDEVKKSLNQLTWIPYNPVTYIANPQIYDRQSKTPVWQNNPYSIDGTIPRPQTIEKSLYLEPIAENQIHLVCSIQGDLDKDILYASRPDMKPIDDEIKAKRQEIIKEYKLKRQQEKQVQEKENIGTESEQESNNNAINNTEKEREI